MSDLSTGIGNANAAFMESFSTGDAQGVASLYTDDGQLLPPGGDVVTGRQAVEDFWTNVMDVGISSARLQTVELEGHGDTAIEIGRYTLGVADGSVADEGKYLVVWKRRDGAWKLHRDIWNTSRGG